MFFTVFHPFCLYLSSPHLPLFVTVFHHFCLFLSSTNLPMFFTDPCLSLFFTISVSTCPALTYPCFSPFPGTCPRLRPATLRRIKGVRILPHTVRSVFGLPAASRVTARRLSLWNPLTDCPDCTTCGTANFLGWGKGVGVGLIVSGDQRKHKSSVYCVGRPVQIEPTSP